LFHRAASQSGAINTILTREDATANAQLLLQELNIGKDKVADLQGVPLILSSVLDEAALRLNNFDLDDAGLVDIINKQYGADGPKILETFKRTYPNTTPFLLQARIFSQFDQRNRVLKQADRKAAAGGAPVWVYRFDFPSPAYGGKFRT